MPMEVFGVFALIGLAILFRLAAGSMDHDRVRQYVKDRGGTVTDVTWAPFGPGWFGERRDRIYQVHYTDAMGNLHEAHCKTSLFSGVYFTQDNVVRYVTPNSFEQQTLKEENQRLREEVERLRRGNGGVS